MNTTIVALVLVSILAVGIYIGVSGIVTQYAIDTSGSSAGSLVCAPSTPTARIGQAVRWTVAGLPGGTIYHWASDEGASRVLTDGSFSVTYDKTGEKTASLFYAEKNRWMRITCSTTVQ